MNVAVKPAVKCTELRAHEDEGLGDPSSLQESVQIIHHPGRQQHLSVSARNQDMLQTGPGGLFIQLPGSKTPSMKDEYNRPPLISLISNLLVSMFITNPLESHYEKQK